MSIERGVAASYRPTGSRIEREASCQNKCMGEGPRKGNGIHCEDITISDAVLRAVAHVHDVLTRWLSWFGTLVWSLVVGRDPAPARTSLTRSEYFKYGTIKYIFKYILYITPLGGSINYHSFFLFCHFCATCLFNLLSNSITRTSCGVHQPTQISTNRGNVYLWRYLWRLRVCSDDDVWPTFVRFYDCLLTPTIVRSAGVRDPVDLPFVILVCSITLTYFTRTCIVP